MNAIIGPMRFLQVAAGLLLSILLVAWSSAAAIGEDGSAVAGHAPQSVLARWYAALETVDPAAIGEMLAEDATIRLADLGVVQSKAEFVDALDAWADAIAGGSIAWRMAPDAEQPMTNGATALVCYRFSGQAEPVLVRESFTFDAAGRIAVSEQQTVDGPCAGF